jgi:CheY-like chemotaxis protein
VEDSAMTLKLYKKMWAFALSKFSIFNVVVDVARDGDEAVKLVKDGNEYLVIMMDIEMPRVGGIDAAKLLRLLQVQSCIIACSSHTLDEVASETFRGDILVSSIDHFIHKPLTRDNALEITARYILPKLIHIPIFKPMSAIVEIFKSDSPSTEKRTAEEPTIVETHQKTTPTSTSKNGKDPVIPASVIRGLLGYVLDTKLQNKR